ncbi:hypothetical protein D3C83_248140 [compost metagenome]
MDRAENVVSRDRYVGCRLRYVAMREEAGQRAACDNDGERNLERANGYERGCGNRGA